MDAGKLRQTLVWQYQPTGRDASGAMTGDWTDGATVFAYISPLSGSRFFAALQSQSRVTHEIWMRYRTGVTTAMRLRLGSGDSARYFVPSAIIDVDERHEYLKVMAEEIVQ